MTDSDEYTTDSSDWTSDNSTSSEDDDGGEPEESAEADEQLEGKFTGLRALFDLFDPEEDTWISTVQFGFALCSVGVLEGVVLDRFIRGSPETWTALRRDRTTFDHFLKIVLQEDFTLLRPTPGEDPRPRSIFGGSKLPFPELLYCARVFNTLRVDGAPIKHVVTQLAQKGVVYHKNGVPVGTVKKDYLALSPESISQTLPEGVLPACGYSKQLAQWAAQAWAQEIEDLVSHLILPCAQLCQKGKHCCCTAVGLEKMVRDFETSAQAREQCEALKQHRAHILQTWEAFNLFDVDKSGTITRSEVAQMLGSLGHKVTPQEIDRLVRDVDENEDGELSFPELIQFAANLVQSSTSGSMITEIRELFGMIVEAPALTMDVDGLSALLGMCGLPASKRRVSELCREVENEPAVTISMPRLAVMLALYNSQTSPLARRMCQRIQSWQAIYALLEPLNTGGFTMQDLKGFGRRIGTQIHLTDPLEHRVSFVQMIQVLCHTDFEEAPSNCVATTMLELVGDFIEFWSVLAPQDHQGRVSMTDLRGTLELLGAEDEMISSFNSLIPCTEVHGSGVTFEGVLALYHDDTLAPIRHQFQGLRMLFSRFDTRNQGFVTLPQLEAAFVELVGADWWSGDQCELFRAGMARYSMRDEPLALTFRDFIQMVGFEGVNPKLESELWRLTSNAPPRFKEDDLDELRFLVLHHPPEKRTLLRAAELCAVLCEDPQRMSLGAYFQGLSQEGMKMLYMTHMQLVQLQPGVDRILPQESAHVVYIVVQGSMVITVNEQTKDPSSVWAGARAVLVQILNSLDLIAWRGKQMTDAWNREKVRTGRDDGPLSVSPEVSKLLRSVGKLRDRVQGCYNMCASSVHEDLADVLLHPGSYEALQQLFRQIQKVDTNSEEFLQRVLKQIVLARSCGQCWTTIAQDVHSADLLRHVCVGTSTCCRQLASLLEGVEERRDAILEARAPWLSGPSSPRHGPSSPRHGPLSPRHGPLSPRHGPLSPRHGPSSPPTSSWFKGTPQKGPSSPRHGPAPLVLDTPQIPAGKQTIRGCPHLELGPGACFGDRALMERSEVAASKNTWIDESKHLVGCRAGAAGVTLLCLEAKAWHNAVHVDALHCIEAFPMFSKLNPRDKRVLVQCMRKKVFTMGETLCTIGDVSETIFLVTEGEVKVQRRAGSVPLEMAILSAGDLIDEAAHGETGRLVHASEVVAAAGTVSVYEIPRSEIDHLLSRRKKSSHYKELASTRSSLRDTRQEKLEAVVAGTVIDPLNQTAAATSPQEAVPQPPPQESRTITDSPRRPPVYSKAAKSKHLPNPQPIQVLDCAPMESPVHGLYASQGQISELAKSGGFMKPCGVLVSPNSEKPLIPPRPRGRVRRDFATMLDYQVSTREVSISTGKLIGTSRCRNLKLHKLEADIQRAMRFAAQEFQ